MAKYAKVIGNGIFPMDMLRYDKCYPVGDSDAVNISRTFYDKISQYEINICTNLSKFTVDRWRSFGVSIVEFKDYRSLFNGKQ